MTLDDFVAAELATPLPPPIAMMAERLAGDADVAAVLFYGSVLRTGDLDGVLDFYVLTDARRGGVLHRTATRWLWPDVSFHEMAIGDAVLRAKVATMPLQTFEDAASGRMLDTTIWTRFVQPAALAWVRDADTAARVRASVAAAAVTAAGYAAALGPENGTADSYWRALFRQTYRAELRVEKPGREDQILRYDPARWQRLLPLAWNAGGIRYDTHGELLTPSGDRARPLRRWQARRRAGRPLNVARLVKAAFTLDGAARYGLWKIERHTGIHIPLTPWRERHPVLAAPAVLWRVMRARSAEAAR